MRQKMNLKNFQMTKLMSSDKKIKNLQLLEINSMLLVRKLIRNQQQNNQ